MEEQRVKLFYRLPAISFKPYLEKEENANYYDGLIINANIIALRKKSVMQFLIKTQKPYIIDPVTYKFNLRKYELIRDGKIQKSIEELSKEYGATIKERISQTKSLGYDDFQQNSGLIDEIAKEVLAFQKSLGGKPSPGQKYKRMLGEREEETVQPPIFLIAPYFYVSEQEGFWHDISRKLAHASLKYRENFDLYVTILIHKDLLYETSFLDSTISDYKALDGYLIWIDDLQENNSSTTRRYDLIQYRRFIETLAEQTEKPIYTMYSGYFSALMGKFGLTGFCSGVRFGESKKYNYATEEIGPVRFYLPILRKKIPENYAAAFFGMFPEEMCSCDLCTKRIRDIKSQSPTINNRELVGEFFENMDAMFKISHYMASRYAEAKQIQSCAVQELKQSLKEDIQKITSLGPVLKRRGLEKIFDSKYIENWMSVI